MRDDIWGIAGHGSMAPWRAAFMYELMIRNKTKSCLELGCQYGIGSLYMAAAIDENGGGNVTTVDVKEFVNKRKIKPQDIINKTNLGKYINIMLDDSSYTWFLYKEIKEQTNKDGICVPKYDFCYIDGAKNWEYDGFSFFLVDKLLKDGGIIIFDDMYFSYKDKNKTIKEMKENSCGRINDEQMGMKQIKLVYDYLVVPHENYGGFTIVDDIWGVAQKKKNGIIPITIFDSEIHIEKLTDNLSVNKIYLLDSKIKYPIRD